MKFLYEYRTRDNVRRQGEIRAATREAAFAALKQKGIRPGCVTEAPGFFNKLFGKGKRWIAIGALGVLVVLAAFVIQSNNRTIRTIEQSQGPFDSPLRRQIIGDSAVIEEGLMNGWAGVFELEGDRFLASFAVPGVPAAVRTTTEDEIRKALDVSTVPGAPSRRGADMSLEERQIRAIVAGMKDELRAFLADGGTIVEYGRCLAERQTQEIGYDERFSKEIERAKESGMDTDALTELWQTYNAKLRRLGIKLIAFPD